MKERIPTYEVITFGCQMNDHDSEVMAGMLESLGYEPAASTGEADVILVNTCCVRETAENKIYGLLGRLAHLKDKKGDLIIGIAGCMTQQPEVTRKIKNRFPQVDLILGTHNLHRLPELLLQARECRERVVEIWDQAGEIVENLPIRRASRVKAWVNITYGCNNFCTYCIVPYVRGRERSRRPEDILNEIRQLVQEGYREVTLLGQNVNSYGKDLPGPASFARLLTEVDQIPGLWRIRFTTSHPRDFTRELIDTIARCPHVCEHIHLPVQAGSNRILKLMNRGYDRDYYLDLVERIRRAIPGVAITTDIMVGFPGETEEDFAQTMDLVERVRFDGAFTFVYNPRPGTPAARFPEQVPDGVKSERIQKLIERQNEITLAHNKALVGRVEQILVEGESKTNPEMMSGRTRTNRLVIFPGSRDLAGQLVNVTVTGARLTHLEGKLAATV
ncbi:tRNA-2-methylthio-N6-dimethylallyladenosine synthase [Desulfofundulus luciae]|uniref:tRNA-2-methylthio-N(6)-dimethylallyladenosine synthase n=1 Tax=Desulfofundulus luciae TaxID=74702 RepID=A0ABU0AZ74_9FIRM|nr:tRNA (N6-isopentenyl adenosine(37)-C2)-methylthiotransferase MiaB [Desulfofundulus luciae]MDQ0285767.1 tRNA-2-methylthio-N6-dimethylallyladenosine synthase [Desulfofundulus luciae]